MKRPPRHAVVCAIVVASALLADFVLGRYAEPHDVLAAALTHLSAAELAAVALLLALRLFLVLLAPGWVMYVMVRWIEQVRHGASRKLQPSPAARR